jgi:hypothetical protein
MPPNVHEDAPDRWRGSPLPSKADRLFVVDVLDGDKPLLFVRPTVRVSKKVI